MVNESTLILFTSGKHDEGKECTVPHDNPSRNLAKLGRVVSTAVEAIGMCIATVHPRRSLMHILDILAPHAFIHEKSLRKP